MTGFVVQGHKFNYDLHFHYSFYNIVQKSYAKVIHTTFMKNK